jgi:hypothetical protein
MTLSLRPIVNHAVPTHRGHSALEAQEIVGNSGALRDAVALARKVAAGIPILLVGETGPEGGSGQAIIVEWSARPTRQLDCGLWQMAPLSATHGTSSNIPEQSIHLGDRQ